jgi:hypothetical protein
MLCRERQPEAGGRSLNDCQRTPLSEAKVVEASGVEPGRLRFSNWLMVNDFWSKVLILRRFHSLVHSTPFCTIRRDSTWVLETFWRRTLAASVGDDSRIEGTC